MPPPTSIRASGAAAVAAAGLLATPAVAASAPDLRPAFTGTVVSTYPDGRQAKLWLDSNGSYRGQGRRGRPSSGRWTLKGDRVCLKQSRPFPAPFAHCARVPPEGATSWTDKAVTGEQIRVELVPGR